MYFLFSQFLFLQPFVVQNQWLQACIKEHHSSADLGQPKKRKDNFRDCTSKRLNVKEMGLGYN